MAFSVVTMGFTGLIFGAIAAAWLVYLVPYFLRHRADDLVDGLDQVEQVMPVTIVQHGMSLAEVVPAGVEISTPLTRRAKLRELRLLDAQAAQRRRRVLIFLLVVQLLVAGLAAFGIGEWWAALIPFGLIVAFLAVARFSVRAMRADLDRRAEEIRAGGEEETTALSLDAVDDATHEHSIELSLPVQPVGSLWDPIPITRPTYVSAPLAPRTVRTIDLSAPVPPAAATPVTADPIEEPAAASEPTQEIRQEDAG